MEKYDMVVGKIPLSAKISDAEYGKMLKLLDSDHCHLTQISLEEYTIVALIDNCASFKKHENPDHNIVFFVEFLFDNPDLFTYGNSFTYDGIRFAAIP